MQSAAETRQIAKSTQRAWALVSPALVILAIAAIGPLIVVLIYSFLT
ncbi:MAG: ABC transporter permease, partial [Rhodobacteraceae bacterium]|nr:ABC transporter permease [Paracoccaceae bacterium]